MRIWPTTTSGFVMRLAWLELAKVGGHQVEEPVAYWQAEGAQAAERTPVEIKEWLFRKRR